MQRLLAVGLCFLSVLASTAHGQSSGVEPLHVPAGTALNFYLHTRLNPSAGDAVDTLPKGTVLRVKILDSIDSNVNRDGAEFRGSLASPLLSDGEVVVPAEAEVVGVLALLRSSRHPEGFRYELLITGMKVHGKFYPVTASLDQSFADVRSQRASGAKAATISEPA